MKMRVEDGKEVKSREECDLERKRIVKLIETTNRMLCLKVEEKEISM